MAKLYSDLVNFISGIDIVLKIVISALLLLLCTMLMIKIVKTHYNKDKMAIKYSMIILLILLVAITVFFCYHAFF